jgi:hypothetical protein
VTEKKKTTLLEMILFQEEEISRVDAWEAVYRREGRELPPGFARRRFFADKTRATLELVQAHEKSFLETIRRARAAEPALPPTRAAPQKAFTESADDDAETAVDLQAD